MAKKYAVVGLAVFREGSGHNTIRMMAGSQDELIKNAQYLANDSNDYIGTLLVKVAGKSVAEKWID